jgi:hypothetical protein
MIHNGVSSISSIASVSRMGYHEIMKSLTNFETCPLSKSDRKLARDSAELIEQSESSGLTVLIDGKQVELSGSLADGGNGIRRGLRGLPAAGRTNNVLSAYDVAEKGTLRWRLPAPATAAPAKPAEREGAEARPAATCMFSRITTIVKRVRKRVRLRNSASQVKSSRVKGTASRVSELFRVWLDPNWVVWDARMPN